MRGSYVVAGAGQRTPVVLAVGGAISVATGRTAA